MSKNDMKMGEFELCTRDLGGGLHLMPRGHFWNVPCPWWAQMFEMSYNTDKESSRAQLRTHSRDHLQSSNIKLRQNAMHVFMLCYQLSLLPHTSLWCVSLSLSTNCHFSTHQILTTRLWFSAYTSQHLNCEWCCLFPRLFLSLTEFVTLSSGCR